MAIKYWKARDIDGADTISYSASSTTNSDSGAVVTLKPGTEKPMWLFNRSMDVANNQDPYQLFHHTPPQITYTESSKDMRVANTVLLGMAYNESKKTGKLTADSDLSPHSASLVRRAVDMGIAQPHPDNQSISITNNMDFHDEFGQNLGPYFHWGKEAPEHEVRAGREATRDLFRSRKRQNLSDQQFKSTPAYEQLKFNI